MIRVNVILDDGRKVQAEVDPVASKNEVKRRMVEALSLGKPEEFLLAFANAPDSEDTSINKMELRDGDLIFVFRLHAIRGPIVRLH